MSYVLSFMAGTMFCSMICLMGIRPKVPKGLSPFRRHNKIIEHQMRDLLR